MNVKRQSTKEFLAALASTPFVDIKTSDISTIRVFKSKEALLKAKEIYVCNILKK